MSHLAGSSAHREGDISSACLSAVPSRVHDSAFQTSSWVMLMPRVCRPHLEDQSSLCRSSRDPLSSAGPSPQV